MLKHFLLTLAALAGTATANAGFAVSCKLNPDDKTAVITTFQADLTSGRVELPTSVYSNGETYTIIGVEPHALDNMTEVTSVVIPGSYTQLGNITASSQDVSKMNGKGAAFLLNCPKLAKIEIDGTSSIVKVTGAGILVSADGKDTYLLPPLMDVPDNTLRMSSTCTRIGAGAFNLNSGIATLVFPSGLEYVAPDVGFHLMYQITAYEIAGSNPTYMIYNGALINKKTSTLVSLPRYYSTTTYYVDYTYTQNVGAYAFANNRSVVSYSLPAPIKQIGDYSFSGSYISQVTLYPEVNLSAGGKGAFSNCSRLTSINIKGEKVEIPADFASDCGELRSITFDGSRPAGVGARAFRNCNKLNQFPFAGDIQWRGDSIFANTGFTEIVYIPSVSVQQDQTTTGLFAGCNQLRKLDMSGITFIHSNSNLAITQNFASDCPKLEELHFPNYVDFRGFPFNGDNALKKIIMANYSRTEKNVFNFTGDKEYSPSIYLVVPYGKEMTSSPIANLVTYTDGATGKTDIYCAAYYCSFFSDEYDPNNRFYIPGGSRDNYPEWTDGEEMFSFSGVGDDNGITITCVPKMDNVVMDKVTFGYADTVNFDGNTEVKTTTPLSTISNILIYYKVNDVQMWTTYPATKISSTGIESVSEKEALYATLSDKTLTFGRDADFSIFTTSGAMIMSGHAESVSLEDLESGVYVVTAAADGKAVSTKIVL